ncbi:similar to Saccharomyces cerevisiae YHR133C NSG1 Protein involved in regulation of sterol biosynthesis [Maudiozyma saulgeensis]|uniref:Similar to Saccharomyces cerevisiae YHR133C NSG1 Protein involved in regulation of sterol biosynthesis n=1 Tax=Maudiozyma saulgeensis TaxID=1789683 RepID=A0A1X7R0M9_9SACH|nr:similar to Saccharomyces cerevisiae YHR133C NSG1 Protein involved in regulation of sterol biosynthesis [Kazachstania saulgeensis]
MSGSQNRKSSDKIFKSESISSLTKPQLFSLYDEDITNPTESNSLYQIINDTKLKNTQTESPLHSDNSTLFQKLIHFIFSVFVLGVSGIVYLEISQNLHDNHQLHSSFTSKPVIVINKIIKWIFADNIPTILKHEWIIYSIEGILFGSVIPILDLIFLQKSQAQLKNGDSSLFGILRIVNAMLGVAFGIRKLDWSSSLQASSVWGLLNIIMWLFFDGTKSLLMESLLASLGVTISCLQEFQNINYQNWEISQFLYFEDFYFLGFLIFGKLGRYLFF